MLSRPLFGCFSLCSRSSAPRDAPSTNGLAEMTDSVPQRRGFFCREWALQRLQHCLEGVGEGAGGRRAPGILITGGPGAGKTALCEEILRPASSSCSSGAGLSAWLGARVLAHHFCRAHAHSSLDPKIFIQSLARQLRHSTLLRGYHGDADTSNCQGDLREIFKRVIVLPLAELPPPSQNLLLLVDSVDEACCCCRLDGFGAESSCTIAELLANHHELLPPWLLLVCTARRQNKSVTRMFTGFRRLCLDDLRKAHIVRDVQHYILRRLDGEAALRMHLTLDTAEMLNQLHIKSNGCFLYLERVLDGVADGSILIREIRHIPGTLNGLYLWLCQRLFPGRHFCQVQTLLNALLAAPAPLTTAQLHRAVWTKQTRGWSHEEFSRVLELLAPLIRPVDDPEMAFRVDRPEMTHRVDGLEEPSCPGLVIFHHSFSEWLLDVKYCTQRYLCSVAEGHGMLAMSLSMRAPDLAPEEVHQLARHLLLSDLRGVEPAHLALWLLSSGVPVSDCLASDIPLELEVLQLLLLARPTVDGLALMEDSGALRRTLERGAGSMEMLLDSGGSLNKRDRVGRTLLAAAAYAGNLEAVTLMISRGANLEATDDYGQTALGLAAHRGHLAIVELLLQHGANIDHADSQGWTPLRSASWGGHTEVVEELLAAGAQPDISGPDGRTALRAAAWGGHEGPVKALLRAGAAIDHADIEGWTPLMTAAYIGHRNVAALLLDTGADVNRSDSEGRTALAMACLSVPAGRAYPEMVSLLLERGADPELEDQEGVTPLLVAAYEGKEEVGELLLEAGADPDRAGGGHMTPLLAAASGGHAEMVRVLLLWGAATDVTDSEGRSPLVLAASAPRGEEAVRVLLDRGLNENHQDLLGWTALHWAACEGRRGACRALIDGGAKPGMRDIEGYTPLHLAAQEGHTSCAELLIIRGSSVDQRATDHMTALSLAALGGHKATVQLLLKKGADPDMKSADGKPLLVLLALQGLTDMVEILLDHGVDLEARDPEERSALHACCWQGDADMAQILLDKGKANCNAFDKERRTPLHCAAWRGHANVAHLLLESGAFADAQCSQGATPLCIAAQEGHEELARVLLEEGKASPFHADHYGRTPIKVAAKGGHLAIVHLLEKHGVPPYQGIMGKPASSFLKDRVEGSAGSWSTLSPVSTCSQSLDNSLKSSKGSVLTSSTFHSTATVPADSLTFTQQLQQHSLPRSRSRQAVALTGLQGPPAGAFHHEQEASTVIGPLPSSPDRELRRNGILTNPKYGSPTYARYMAGEPLLPHSHHSGKSGSSGYFSSHGGNERAAQHKTADPTERTADHKKTTDPTERVSDHKKTTELTERLFNIKKTTDPPGKASDHKKTNDPAGKTRSPLKSPKKPDSALLTSSEKPVPVSQIITSPKKSSFPLTSSKELLALSHISSPKKRPQTTPDKFLPTSQVNLSSIKTALTSSEELIPASHISSVKKCLTPVTSSEELVAISHIGSPKKIPLTTSNKLLPGYQVITSPKKTWISSEKPMPPSHISSPKESPAPLTSEELLVFTSPKKTSFPLTSSERLLPTSSPKKSPASLTPSKKEAFYLLKKPPTSPPRLGEADYPLQKPEDFVYSPKNLTMEASPNSEARLSPNSETPSSPSSPVISITTMDPQLHLKQAIKLQFEGRTCGFNYRKETPL